MPRRLRDMHLSICTMIVVARVVSTISRRRHDLGSAGSSHLARPAPRIVNPLGNPLEGSQSSVPVAGARSWGLLIA